MPRAVVQSRVPAVLQGLCAGAGTLPPSRLSIQHKRTGNMICRWHEDIRKMSVSRL